MDRPRQPGVRAGSVRLGGATGVYGWYFGFCKVIFRGECVCSGWSPRPARRRPVSRAPGAAGARSTVVLSSETTLVSGVVRCFVVCKGVEGVVHSRLGGVILVFNAF